MVQRRVSPGASLSGFTDDDGEAVTSNETTVTDDTARASDDHAEALAAFLEKREPKFGRKD